MPDELQHVTFDIPPHPDGRELTVEEITALMELALPRLCDVYENMMGVRPDPSMLRWGIIRNA